MARATAARWSFGAVRDEGLSPATSGSAVGRGKRGRVGASIPEADPGDRGTGAILAIPWMDAAQCDGRGRITGHGQVRVASSRQTRGGGRIGSAVAGGGGVSSRAGG